MKMKTLILGYFAGSLSFQIQRYEVIEVQASCSFSKTTSNLFCTFAFQHAVLSEHAQETAATMGRNCLPRHKSNAQPGVGPIQIRKPQAEQ